MGYRSDVHLVIYGDQDKFDAFVMRLRMDGTLAAFDSDHLPIVEKRVRQYKKIVPMLELKCEYVKWYAEFEDVQRAMAMLERAEEMGLYYEFMRIGEDTEDIEIKTSDDHMCMLGISRSITADYEDVISMEKENNHG